MQPWTYTSDIPEKFFTDLLEVAERLECAPWDLLGVWNSESGLRASAHNPNGHASGFFQAMPDTLRLLGYQLGHEAFRALTIVEQLPWAERYYRPYTGRLVNGVAVYVATFLPADLDLAKEPEAILTAKDGRRAWAFTANAVFDTNRDFKITVKELDDAIRRNCRTHRYQEAEHRLRMLLGDQSGPITEPDYKGFDLGRVRDVQAALQVLGFDPGPIDGILGPQTRSAVLAFQTANPPLAQDGIYGPHTRQALQRCLDAFSQAAS